MGAGGGDRLGSLLRSGGQGSGTIPCGRCPPSRRLTPGKDGKPAFSTRCALPGASKVPAVPLIENFWESNDIRC